MGIGMDKHWRAEVAARMDEASDDEMKAAVVAALSHKREDQEKNVLIRYVAEKIAQVHRTAPENVISPATQMILSIASCRFAGLPTVQGVWR